MRKRIARQGKRKVEKPKGKSRRKLIVIICSSLSLMIALGLMAQWKIMLSTSTPFALAPNPPGSFSASLKSPAVPLSRFVEASGSWLKMK